MKIALTGSRGFIGSRFAEYNKGKFEITPIFLREQNLSGTDLSSFDAVLHFAGIAHQMKPIPDRYYYEVNFDLTKALAEKAKHQGVRHFVFMSTTKVYGDKSHTILDEHSACSPADPYGRSKFQAEEVLRLLTDRSFKVAIVRPPLVYGPGVKGNMLRLIHLAEKDIPLPFGNAGNARSIVFVSNLIEMINTIIEKQKSGLFIAGDKEPVSSDELIRMIRFNLGKKERLFSVPIFCRDILKQVAPGLYTRLFGSFVVNNEETNRLLSFLPPYSTKYGIEQMTNWYLQHSQNHSLGNTTERKDQRDKIQS